MTTTIPARDWELTCHECDGSGHVYVKHQVAERKTDMQEFKEECECCEGRGFVFAFQDIPGIEEYVKACRPAPAAPGVSTVEDPSFPTGAIVNGRVLADRLEAYPFESQGGDLRLCSDWVEFRRCFEHLAEWVGSRAPAAGDAQKEPMIVLSGQQLLDALEFVAPDREPLQLECTVAIQFGEGHSGAGHYCWLDDSPDEGAILLRPEPDTTDELDSVLDELAAQRKGDAR